MAPASLQREACKAHARPPARRRRSPLIETVRARPRGVTGKTEQHRRQSVARTKKYLVGAEKCDVPAFLFVILLLAFLLAF